MKLFPRPTLTRAALFLLLQQAAASAASTNCSSYSTRYQKNLDGVCVCSASSCDSISTEYTSLPSGKAGVFTTSEAGDRLTYSTVTVLDSSNSSNATTADFTIDTSTTYQSIIGFGGAFTDAAAINVYLLEDALQTLLLEAYYGETGLQYSLGRIPIASTDFSTSVYSYNDVADDFNMTNFSIDVDKAPSSNKLDLIQRALSKSSREIKMFASSWAPPAWMTTTNSTINCALQGEPGGVYYEALALYYSKFIDAYEAEGVSIWGMTVQNEPYQQPVAFNSWQSLRLTAEQERDFLKLDLGPLMMQNHPDLKIMILDDQKDLLLTRNASLIDAEAAQYVSGVGLHWYKDLDFLLDTYGNFDDMKTFHEQYPDVFMLATEACSGYLLDGIGTGAGTKLQQSSIIWERGVVYARDIIGDLNAFASGWTDWNLALNTTGGPNWANNLVDSPILVDEEGGAEFYKQPMYYVMGHFSKFIPAASTRVSVSTSSNSSTSLANVQSVAFVTPESQVVLVLLNLDSTEKNVTVSLSADERELSVTLPANAIQTILVGEKSHASC